MKKYLIVMFVVLSTNTFAQLHKDQWLIGGNGLFSSSKSKELTFISAQLSPAIGYFFKDKIAGGLRFGFNSQTRKYEDDKLRTSSISAAPFLRYYFLPVEQKLNVFVDGAFGYSWAKSRTFTPPSSHRYKYYNFSVMAGPAIFLNERTALEVTVAYTYLSRGPVDTTLTNRIQFGIGLQVHLGKH